jgi:hypothetical protein
LLIPVPCHQAAKSINDVIFALWDKAVREVGREMARLHTLTSKGHELTFHPAFKDLELGIRPREAYHCVEIGTSVVRTAVAAAGQCGVRVEELNR